jgi:hypothetical protein
MHLSKIDRLKDSICSGLGLNFTHGGRSFECGKITAVSDVSSRMSLEKAYLMLVSLKEPSSTAGTKRQYEAIQCDHSSSMVGDYIHAFIPTLNDLNIVTETFHMEGKSMQFGLG